MSFSTGFLCGVVFFGLCLLLAEDIRQMVRKEVARQNELNHALSESASVLTSKGKVVA